MIICGDISFLKIVGSLLIQYNINVKYFPFVSPPLLFEEFFRKSRKVAIIIFN